LARMTALAGSVDGRRRWLLGSGAVLLGGLVYLNALRSPFVYDDHLLVVENASIRDLGRLGPLLLEHRFRPLLTPSYALDYRLWGPPPVGYHVTSVLLPLVNVGLVFRLASVLVSDARARGAGPAARQPQAAGIAFATAALFAVHPIMTEAVSY